MKAMLKIKKLLSKFIATFLKMNFSNFNNFITVNLFNNNVRKVVKGNIQYR